MHKNVNKVVVIVSPVASHLAISIPSFVLQTVVVQNIHVEFSLLRVQDLLGILEQNSGKPDRQTCIQKAKGFKHHQPRCIWCTFQAKHKGLCSATERQKSLYDLGIL